MIAPEHVITDDAEHRLPVVHSLVFPPDGGAMEGRSVLFEWDLRDVQNGPARFKLVLKRQATGQSAGLAIAGEEIAFEALVEHVQFFVMRVSELRFRSASYVWRVIALGERDGKPTEI